MEVLVSLGWKYFSLSWASLIWPLVKAKIKEQEAIPQKEIVFHFRKDIQSLRKAGVLISCAWEVLGWGGYVLMRRFAPHWSALLPEPGFFVQVRFSTEPIVKVWGLINLCCLHMYQLLQSTRFEMYLLVILLLNSALGQGGGCFLASAT